MKSIILPTTHAPNISSPLTLHHRTLKGIATQEVSLSFNPKKIVKNYYPSIPICNKKRQKKKQEHRFHASLPTDTQALTTEARGQLLKS